VQTSLPIWQIHSDVIGTLRSGNRLVLVAPTGSGKTTQVPQMLLEAGLAGERKIVVLQPRRVAARTVAARVAWERGCPLGAEVGYQIRFEDRTSLGTRICYVTEGILLRWLQDDRTLEDVSVLLFDEFHERNLLSDVALALAKELVDMNILTRLTSYRDPLPEWWTDELGRPAIGFRVRNDLNRPDLDPRLSKMGADEIEQAVGGCKTRSKLRQGALAKTRAL
jgi:hypothetical protein